MNITDTAIVVVLVEVVVCIYKDVSECLIICYYYEFNLKILWEIKHFTYYSDGKY